MKETENTPTVSSHSQAHQQQLLAAISNKKEVNGIISLTKAATTPVLESDLILDQSRFDSSSASADTLAFNRKLQEIETTVPKWYQVRHCWGIPN